MFFRFVVVLHSHFLFPRHLSPFRGLLPGFYTHFIFSAQPIAEWFTTFSFSTIRSSSCRERNSLEWAFFTHRRFFTLRSFIDILTCVYHGFPGSRQSFLGVCRASYWLMILSIRRPVPSVCLIQSNLQSSYSERFSFKFYYILAWITCGSSLIYLFLTRFELFSLVQSHM